MSAAVATGLHVWLAVSGAPPATVPLAAEGGEARSAPFRVYASGLYVVVLQIEPTSGCGGRGACPVKELPATWTVYRRGALVARDALGPAAAVEPGRVFVTDRREERELGAVELTAGSGYVLAARLTGPLPPGAARPRVQVRLHPWDVKAGLDLLVFFALSAAVAAAALLWLLGAVISALWRK